MSNSTLQANKMGSEPVLKLIISMSLPAMFSMIIQALYNIVDSIFVAQVSENALTAVSLAYPLQMLLISFAVGTGVGVNSLVSRRLGEGHQKDANSAAAHGIILGAINWVVFLILGFTITGPFFSAYTDNPEIYQMGTQYLSCVMIFSFGMFIELVIEKTLQATGNMIFPMFFMLTGAVTNIILDPIFIFGFGPVPAMGVLGAAIATVIGQIFSMIFSIAVLVLKNHAVNVSFKKFKFSGKTIKNIYSVGVPAIVMQSIGSVMLLGMNAILIGFSTTAVSVLGVYFKLQSFVFMPVFGLTHGVMPIMGYNYGARNKKRLMEALKYGSIIAFIIMVLGTIAFWLFPEQLMGMFNANDDMVQMGKTALRAISLCFIPATVGIMFITFFQAVGKGARSLIISVLRQLGILLPVAYMLSFCGLEWVWYAFPIAEVAALITAIILFVHLMKTDIKNLEVR
ncbi:MAG TPA: MATE family efflux transporter [Clostridiales bacterium]|nr:MATE family efflux transporter [Clostridiales bacterium]